MKKKVFNVVLYFLICYLVFVISLCCFDVNLYELACNKDIEVLCIYAFSVCVYWFFESLSDLFSYFFENRKKKTQE